MMSEHEEWTVNTTDSGADSKSSNRSWDNPPPCSNCGSTRVALVIYGHPNFDDEELMRAYHEGRVIFGGCVVWDVSYWWRCRDCFDRDCHDKGNEKDRSFWQVGQDWNDDGTWDFDRIGRFNPDDESLPFWGFNQLGRFDPNESDAAKRARLRDEKAKREAHVAYMATPIGAYEHLLSLILAAEEDIRKAENGDTAAGVRVRGTMMEAKTAAKRLRSAILTARKAHQEP